MARAWMFRVRGPAFRRAGSSDLIEGDVSTTEETCDDADSARGMAAHRRGVPLTNVEHVLDDDGAPIYREYEPLRGMLGRARESKYDRDNEIPRSPGNGRGKVFF